MRITLSIIIPIYNVENYVKGCLESILSQLKRKDIEVILVNDGTPDNSMSIVAPLISNYDNVYVINKENGGLSSARNVGLRAAKGDFVWFVDSDDTLLPNALEDVCNILNARKDLDVIATVLLLKRESTGKTRIEYHPNVNVSTGREYMFAGNNCGASQRFILRRQFLIDNNLFFMEGVYHEDGEFGNKMPYLAKNIYVLEKPVYCYLLREQGSIMSSRKMKMNYDLIKIYHELERFCKAKVAKEDKWKYKGKIFDCLKCTILFSRKEIFSKEFMQFYQEQRNLIHQKAGELLCHPVEIGFRKYVECLHFYFLPLFYTQMKTFIKLHLVKHINALW